MKLRKLCLAVALALSACASSGTSTEGFQVVEVADVILGERSLIVLREEIGARELAMVIGPYEAQSIALAIHELNSPRPNSHDLIKTIMSALEGRVARVMITELDDSVYFAELHVELGRRVVPVDSRPSDAIAVALRTRTPIFVAEKLLQIRASDVLQVQTERGGPEAELRVH